MASDDVKRSTDARSGEEGASGRRAALRATARWAVPLQWVAIVVTGGIASFLALSGRWHVWDWLFVGLCALYVANAVGFRWLTKRNGR